MLCLVLDFAIQTRRLASNPARGVRLPRRPPARANSDGRPGGFACQRAGEGRRPGLRDGLPRTAMVGAGRPQGLPTWTCSDTECGSWSGPPRWADAWTSPLRKSPASSECRHPRSPRARSPTADRRSRSLTTWCSPLPTAATCATATGGRARLGSSHQGARTRGRHAPRPAPDLRVPCASRRRGPPVDPARDGARVHQHDRSHLRTPLRRGAGHRRRGPRPLSARAEGR